MITIIDSRNEVITQSKVNDFEGFFLRVDKDVVRFNISVHDSLRV